MTWETTYTVSVSWDPTNWLVGEEDGGGGVAVQLAALVHKRANGSFYMDDVRTFITGTTEERHFVDSFVIRNAANSTDVFSVNQYRILHAPTLVSGEGSTIIFRGAGGLSTEGLRIADTDDTHTLKLSCGSNLTSNRVLTFITGNSSRNLDISAANVTISTAGAALIDDADPAAQRATLLLGTIATQNANAVAITGGAMSLTANSSVAGTSGTAMTVSGSFGGGYVLDDGGNKGYWHLESSGTVMRWRFTAPGGATSGIQMVSATSFGPAADNSLTCGTAAERWSTVYAATGTINTSDERAKEQIGPIPDEWLDAWGDVEWLRYKFRDAVAEKGDAARWHIGAIAQRVRDAFAARDLDALAIGLLCYDQWDERTEPVIETVTKTRMVPREIEVPFGRANKDGERKTKVKTVKVKEAYEEDVPTGEVRVVREAGDRWGLRMDECFAMDAAYQDRRMARIEARLEKLGGE